jgi:beta-lactamase regulating signal transducer with metallopeptidase domain
MKTLGYLIVASACLSLFYGFYRMIYRHEANFTHQRFYLLLSVAISLVVPLLPQRIELGLNLSGLFQVSPAASDPNSGVSGGRVPFFLKAYDTGPLTSLAWVAVAELVWFAVTIGFLVRMGIMLGILFFRTLQSEKESLADCRIVKNSKHQSPFSFFHTIFLPEALSEQNEIDQVIAHEKIHALQWHSLDRILLEMLSSVMWFNPFVWKMKQSLTLVHEYLADEGALRSGVDRVQYQALLINQVAGGPLITLSSRFNHSLIKKRILMMTQVNRTQSRFRILAITPLTALVLLLAACLNGVIAQPGKTDASVKNSSAESRMKPDSSGIKTISSMPNDILYLVDGKETTAEVVQAIDPNTIESVSVLKDKDMIKKYTAKDVEGVIVIIRKGAAKK